MLETISIHAFLDKYGVKNEMGDLIEFKDHPFLFDIYRDFSPKLCVLKAAQVGMTTCEALKLIWAVKNKKLDAIYILPTDSDVGTMVGSKINRIIAQNPILHKWTSDKDTIEQKQIGNNYVHFRGSWSAKAAIMVTSDWNMYDEVDACKQDVVEQYSTRLQHSKLRYEHYFSHPSASGFGIDKYWQKSDQKHWLIKCDNGHEQYLSWPDSIDQNAQVYICKLCKCELTDVNRRKGRWAKKKDRKDAEYSGYWINLLMCPWVSAKDIIGYYKEKTEEYFTNKVLGLPYVGGGNKLIWEDFAKNLTVNILQPTTEELIVIGIDTGLKLDFVMGGREGLFYHGEAKDYDELDRYMRTWKRAIAIIDAGGDLIGSRKFKERWQGRVYLGYFRGSDKKGEEIFTWGKNDEYFTVAIDRERGIQLAVDYFRDSRIPVQGTEEDWHDYWTDWNNLTRTRQEDPKTMQFKGHKWVRSGRDHRALATVLWLAGLHKFGYNKAEFIGEREVLPFRVAPPIHANQTIRALTPAGQDIVQATLEKLREENENYDWRNV